MHVYTHLNTTINHYSLFSFFFFFFFNHTPTTEIYTLSLHDALPIFAARDEQQQTQFVVDRILELHEEGTPLSEIAVLFRAGYMSADLEIELTNRKIPFEKWGGLKFLEAAHVKDVLAFLRLLETPRDEVSWYR